MKKHIFLLVVGSALLLGAGSCAEPPKSEAPKSEAPKSEQAAPAAGDFRPVATIKDIMDLVVDENADLLWGSVSTVIDAKGVTENYPRTDEEWKKVRAYTMALVEAPNLLMIPRTVAPADTKSQAPGIELQPKEIQALIDGDRATFRTLALCLQATALETLKAVDMKDKDKVSDASGEIDRACERCHQKYWYPAEAKGRPPVSTPVCDRLEGVTSAKPEEKSDAKSEKQEKK